MRTTPVGSEPIDQARNVATQMWYEPHRILRSYEHQGRIHSIYCVYEIAEDAQGSRCADGPTKRMLRFTCNDLEYPGDVAADARALTNCMN